MQYIKGDCSVESGVTSDVIYTLHSNLQHKGGDATQGLDAVAVNRSFYHQ